MNDFEELASRSRQVLRFVATYLAEQDCLPSTSEIALGCGIRSDNTVRRVMRELEEQGYVERDERFPRLGSVHFEVRGPDVALELYLAELSICESNGNLHALRRALRWVPDLDAAEFLHREGGNRVTLYRAYLETRRRLVEAGTVLPDRALSFLADVPERIDQRHRSFSDWASYCVYSTAMSIGARQMFRVSSSLALVHLEPIHVAESTFYDIGSRLDYRVTMQALAQRPEMVHTVCTAVCDALNEILANANAVFKDALAPIGSFGAPRIVAAVEAVDSTISRRERAR